MSDLKTELELAQRMFGQSTGGGLGQGVRRISATAIADSADGTVELDVGGETVEVPVVGHVSSGDEVSVLVEDGVAYAIGTDGWGDAVQTTASSAEAIATAVNQHVWTDTSGVHVTEQDQDDTTGANVLLNSQGLLLRDGTDDLAAFASGGVEFYDAGATIASFSGSGAVIGDASATHIELDADSMVVENQTNPSWVTFAVRTDVGNLGQVVSLWYGSNRVFAIGYDGTINSAKYGVSTESNWTVEKRPGGIIEATRTITGSLAVTSSYAGQYISALQSTSLPSGLFSTIDWAGVEVSYSPGLWDAHLTSVTTSAIGYYIACNASTTASITRRIYVRGR